MSKVAPEGCSLMELTDEATGMTGWWLVVDAWYDRLQEKGGEDGVAAHVSQVLESMGYPTAALPAAKARGHETQLRDEAGRWRSSLFRRADSRPKLEGARFFAG